MPFLISALGRHILVFAVDSRADVRKVLSQQHLPRSVAVYQIDGPLHGELIVDGLVYFLAGRLGLESHPHDLFWREYTALGSVTSDLSRLVERELAILDTKTFLRASFIRQNEGLRYLVMSVPASVWDSSSWMLTARFLSQIYNQLREGLEPSFAKKNRPATESAAEKAESEAVWEKHLKSLQSANLQFPGGETSDFKASFFNMPLPANLFVTIKELADHLSLEAESVLFCIWQIVWAGRCGYETTATSFIQDQRAWFGSDLLGNFSATLPMPFQFAGDIPLEDVLFRLDARTKVLLHHGRGGHLKAGLEPPVVFEMPRGVRAGRAGKVRVNLIKAFHWQQSHVLKLTVWNELTGWRFRYHYDQGKLSESRVKDWHEGFCAALEHAPSALRDPWTDLSVIGAGELARRKVRPTSGNPGLPLPLHQSVARWASMSPDAVAFSAEREVTYAALWQEARAIARKLRRHQLPTGSVVAIDCVRAADTLTAMLGVWEAGLAVFPVGEQIPDRRKARIAAVAGVRCLISDRLVDWGMNIPCLSLTSEDDEPDNSQPLIRADLSAPAFIWVAPDHEVPVPVVLSHLQLRYGIAGMVDGFDLSEYERFVSPAANCFEPGATLLYTSLAIGGHFSAVDDHYDEKEQVGNFPVCRMVEQGTLPAREARIQTAVRLWILHYPALPTLEQKESPVNESATVRGWWTHPGLGNSGLVTDDGVAWVPVKGLEAMVYGTRKQLLMQGALGKCWLGGPCVAFKVEAGAVEIEPMTQATTARRHYMLNTGRLAYLDNDSICLAFGDHRLGHE